MDDSMLSVEQLAALGHAVCAFAHASHIDVTRAAQEALLAMDDGVLSVEQLAALGHAVPEDQELKDLALYLQVAY